MKDTKPKHLTTASHLLIASLLVCIGLGNILVGQRHYSILIEDKNAPTETLTRTEAAIEPEAIVDNSLGDFPLPLEADLNSESKRRRKLEHRLRFYRFVTSGGVVILLLGSFYLLVVVLVTEYRNRTKKSAGCSTPSK